ncbi:unnamed protein product, partial [Tenebrio molitor]
MEWNDDKGNFITGDIRRNIQIEPPTLIPKHAAVRGKSSPNYPLTDRKL